MIRGSDTRYTNAVIHKLNMMKKLAKKIEKGVQVVNLPHLIVQIWTSRHILDLYNAVKCFLHLLPLTKGCASRKFPGRLITIFCVLVRVI